MPAAWYSQRDQTEKVSKLNQTKHFSSGDRKDFLKTKKPKKKARKKHHLHKPIVGGDVDLHQTPFLLRLWISELGCCFT